MAYSLNGDDTWPGGRTGNGGGSTGSTYSDSVTPETGTIQVLVAEGEIFGLANSTAGLKSIYLDNTPVMNGDGSKNFKGVAVSLVSGTNTQAVVKGVSKEVSGEVLSETSVNVQVVQATPQTRSVSSGQSAVRVRISIPALKVIDSTSGNSSGNSVTVKIERQNASYTPTTGPSVGVLGGWEPVTLENSGVITGGPFSTKFTKSYRIDTPLAGTWQIKVTRVSADDADAYHLSATWWDAYTAITDANMRYPNSAVLSVKVNAKDFQSIPQVTALIKGSKVLVPSNYDPATRTYYATGFGTTAGAWDGTFGDRATSTLNKKVWTDNPAWVWFDIATHPRYGAGSFLTASGLDKWTLYGIAVWCDTLVADGLGGTEPRMTTNIYIQGQQNAIKALGQLAAIFWGVVYYASGLVVPVADADSAAVAAFSNANVEGGKFSYEGTARSARHTAAIVRFINPTLGYAQDAVTYEDTAGIARYGYNALDLDGIGCTSQGQALRLARWSILTELMSPETVSFTSGLEGSTVKPGDVIQVADEFRAGQTRGGGRVVSSTNVTNATVTLDAPVTLAAGTYYLKCQTAAGMLETKTVTTGAGTTSTLTVSGVFTSAPAVSSSWLLQAGTTASLWRVLSVKADGLKYSITALLHDPAKYAALGLTSGDVIARNPVTSTSPAPAGLAVTYSTRILNDRQVQTLSAAWTLDGAMGYVAQASRDYGPWTDMVITGAGAILDGIQPGIWRVQVAGDWRSGGLSPYSQVAATITASGTVPTWTAAAQADATTALANAAIANSTAVTAAANAPLIVTGLPTLPNATYPANKLVYDNTTKRLYRSTGSTWEASTTDAGDLTGTLNAARVAVGSLDSKITTITSGQIGSLDAAKLTGTLDAARVAVGSLDSKISVVDAAKLTTGTLDVARIATDAITGAKIAPGAVSASELAVGSVFAKHMTLANWDNLIPNGNSEMDLTAMPSGSWEGVGICAPNSLYSGISGGRSGTYARLVSPSHAPLWLTDFLPCSAGDQFYFEGYAMPLDVAMERVKFYVVFYLADKVTELSGASYGYADTPGGPTTWTKCSVGSAPAPTGAAFVRFVVLTDSTITRFIVDDLYARRMADASLIVDGAITTAKMTANSISGDRISAGSLDASKIVADSISAGQIAANAITSNELAANAVIAGKIQAGTIVAADIAASTITGAKIAATTITASNIAADTITANEIAANAITSNELAANAVIAGKIQAGTIVAADIAASTITGAKIAATTITAANIAADTITAGQIAAAAIGASEIAAGAVFAKHLTIANFDNLIPNPNSEMDLSSMPEGSWEGVGVCVPNSLNSSIPGGRSGSKARLVLTNHAPLFLTDFIPCASGDQFYFEGYALPLDVAMERIKLYVIFYPSDRVTELAFPMGYLDAPGGVTAWNKVSVTTPAAPSSAAFVRFVVLTDSTTSRFIIDDLYARRMNDGNIIVDGAITANKLETDLATANIIRSSNWNGYQQTGNMSSVGYKISGTAFNAKDYAGNLQSVQADFAAGSMMAGFKMGALAGRAMSAIAENGSTGTSARVWYRGSNDGATLSGGPTIASSDGNPATTPRLLINSVYVNSTTGSGSTLLMFQIAPQSYTDNLDAMRYVEVEAWYRSGTSMVKWIDYFPVAICDRRYRAATSDTDTGNYGKASLQLNNASLAVVGLSGATNYVVLKCRLVNAVGESTEHYFTPPSAVGVGTTSSVGRWTDVGTTAPLTGGTGGGTGGGGGGGGTCPAPDVPVLMADGTYRLAGDLLLGDLVAAWDEEAACFCQEKIVAAVPSMNSLMRLYLDNGLDGRFAANHRFLTEDGQWIELQHLAPGSKLRGATVIDVVPAGVSDVVQLTVDRVHTFITLGVVSHNMKILT